jgi:hypothetical protein
MTSRVNIVHGGGNKALAVVDKNGNQVALLEKEGDEFSDLVHGDETFRVEEAGEFLDAAAQDKGDEES